MSAVNRPAQLALRLYVAGVLLFLLLPILAIVPLSLSSGSLLVYPLPGLSLRWYVEVLTSATWMRVGCTATARAPRCACRS